MLPRHLERIVNPNGGVVYRRVVEKQFSNDTLPGFGPVTLMKRPVRTRMQGVVGRAGEKPALTRFGDFFRLINEIREFALIYVAISKTSDSEID